MEKPLDVGIRERREGDGERAALAAAPAGPALPAARGAPCRRRGSERRFGPVDEVVDEVEKPSSAQWSPRRRARGAGLGQGLEEAAPRGERLAAEVAAGRLRPSRPTSGPRCSSTRAPRPRRARRSSPRVPSLAAASSDESDSEDAACAFTISPSAQKLTPSRTAATGPGASWRRPRDRRRAPRRARTGGGSFRSPARRRGDELRRPLALGAGERVPEEAQLLLPPDQLGAAAEGDVHAEAGSRRDHLPDADRLGLPLRMHWLGVAVLDHRRRGPVRRLVDGVVHRCGQLEARAVLTTSPVAMPSPLLRPDESAIIASPVPSRRSARAGRGSGRPRSARPGRLGRLPPRARRARGRPRGRAGRRTARRRRRR